MGHGMYQLHYKIRGNLERFGKPTWIIFEQRQKAKNTVSITFPNESKISEIQSKSNAGNLTV